MKRLAKIMLLELIAVAMIFSVKAQVVNAEAFGGYEGHESAIVVTPGAKYDVTTTESCEVRFFKLVPDTTMMYTFSAETDERALHAHLYDAKGQVVQEQQDFEYLSLNAKLMAKETYYLAVEPEAGTCSYTLDVERYYRPKLYEITWASDEDTLYAPVVKSDYIYRWYAIYQDFEWELIDGANESTLKVPQGAEYVKCEISREGLETITIDYVKYDRDDDIGSIRCCDTDSWEFYVLKGEKLQLPVYGGKEGVTYQWWTADENENRIEQLQGQNTEVLTIDNFQRSGYYICVVKRGTEEYDICTSVVAVESDGSDYLEVNYSYEDPYHIPFSYKNPEKKALEVQVTAPTGKDVKYQWFVEKREYNEEEEWYEDVYEPIAGATKASYIPAATEGGYYCCRISTDTLSKTVEFGIDVKSLTLQGEVSNEFFVKNGGSVTASIFATSVASDKLTYEWSMFEDNDWEVEFLTIPEVNTNTIKINNIQGFRRYKCIISDGIDEVYAFVDVFASATGKNDGTVVEDWDPTVSYENYGVEALPNRVYDAGNTSGGTETTPGSTGGTTSDKNPTAGGNNGTTSGTVPAPGGTTSGNNTAGTVETVKPVGTELVADGAVVVVTAASEVQYKKPADVKAKKVTIPDVVTVSGKAYTVTSIADNALKGNKKVTSVTIGKNIIKIGKNAFSGAKNLKSITIKSKSLKSVGKNAIKGIHKKAKIKCPKKQLKNYKKLFKSKTGFKKSMKLK